MGQCNEWQEVLWLGILVAHMYSFIDGGWQPSREFCAVVAIHLVAKYIFLRDQDGTGYVSVYFLDTGTKTILPSLHALWDQRTKDGIYNVGMKTTANSLYEDTAATEKWKSKNVSYCPFDQIDACQVTYNNYEILRP